MASSDLLSPTVTHARAKTRRRLSYLLLVVLCVLGATMILTWELPTGGGAQGTQLALKLRAISVATIAIVAACQALGTVLFHSVTGNRILTPSIMGFEAVYVLMQTALVFFFGGAMLAATDGLAKVILQSLLMIAFTTALYGWLFSSRKGSLHVTLLVGVVLGVGFASLSTFMQRLLTPSEFDVLSARLFGNLSNSNPEYLPFAAAVLVILAVIVWRSTAKLDVLALGPDVSTSLGLNYRKETLGVLVIISALMSISTSLVGPMAFFGFIVATLSYQLMRSSLHRHVLPFAVLLGMCTLLVGYFILRHVFYAAGVLTIIIEFVGGIFFLVYLLRKGSL